MFNESIKKYIEWEVEYMNRAQSLKRTRPNFAFSYFKVSFKKKNIYEDNQCIC